MLGMTVRTKIMAVVFTFSVAIAGGGTLLPRAEAGTTPDRDRDQDRDHDRIQTISFSVTLDPHDVTVSRSDQSGYDRILLRGHQSFPNPDWVGAPLLPAIQDRLV
ncbi:MAG: hypothetical protein IT349_01245, partial [Candidatus Eisenbacteria bacterium]|nr:hypothetical protein [Candidatus Eisenbacteria bacterium]